MYLTMINNIGAAIISETAGQWAILYKFQHWYVDKEPCLVMMVMYTNEKPFC